MVREQISKEHRQTSQAVVLATLREYGPMTVDELMRRLPRRVTARGRGWDPNRIRPACSELARQGLTYKLMERGRSDAGFPCAIWAAVPKEEDK